MFSDKIRELMIERDISLTDLAELSGVPFETLRNINYRKVKEKYDYITVEGSGGILCPICFDEARIGLTDIIDEMELDCILVADAGLGTINSVVLTYEYMKNRNMNIK